MRRQTRFALLSWAIVFMALVIFSYLAMALDKKSINPNLGLILMALVAVGVFGYVALAIRYYRRNPQSLNYQANSLPFNVRKLPVEIQKNIQDQMFEDQIIQNIEKLLEQKTSSPTSLLIAQAYFTYIYGHKVMLDSDYHRRALRILQEAEQNQEELETIARVRREIESSLQLFQNFNE